MHWSRHIKFFPLGRRDKKSINVSLSDGIKPVWPLSHQNGTVNHQTFQALTSDSSACRGEKSDLHSHVLVSPAVISVHDEALCVGRLED